MLETWVQLGVGVTAIATAMPLNALLRPLTGGGDRPEVATQR
jgi:hypothetical protein